MLSIGMSINFQNFLAPVSFIKHQLRRLDARTLLGLPYFKFLNKENRDRGGQVGQVEFARLQRELLENYLIGLIRAVVRYSLYGPPFSRNTPLDVPSRRKQTGRVSRD
jgi:hypothetical protein